MKNLIKLLILFISYAVYPQAGFPEGINLESETANTILSLNSVKDVKSLSTATYPSLTELAYVKGVTSSIQTQLNGKQPTLTNPVTGTGALNRIAKWSSASAQTSSLLSEQTDIIYQLATYGASAVGNESRYIFNSSGTNGTNGAGIGALKMTTNTADLIMYSQFGFNNSTEIARFKAGGSVGIGTTAPTGKMEIVTGSGTASFDPINQANGSVAFSNATTGTIPVISGKSTGATGLFIDAITVDGAGVDMTFNTRTTTNTDFTTLTTPAFRFTRFGTQLMSILRNGNVGIGNQVSILNSFETKVTTSTGSSSSDGIAIHDGAANRLGLNIGVNQASAYSWIQSIKGGTSTFPNLAVNPNGGNVAIGGTNPVYKLQVNETTAGAGSFIHTTNTITGTTSTDGFIFGVDNAGSTIFINRENTPMMFRTNDIERMRIHASGGVSVGNTTDPGAGNLSVTGKASATVAASAPADLVRKAEFDAAIPLSGSYTPTLTAVTNIASFGTIYPSCLYSRIGNIVNVTVHIVLNTTASTTASEFEVSFPVNKTIAGAVNRPIGLGLAQSSGYSDVGMHVKETATTTKAKVLFTSTPTSSMEVSLTFSYYVGP